MLVYCPCQLQQHNPSFPPLVSSDRRANHKPDQLQTVSQEVSAIWKVMLFPLCQCTVPLVSTHLGFGIEEWNHSSVFHQVQIYFKIDTKRKRKHIFFVDLSLSTGEQFYHWCFGEGSDTPLWSNSTIQHMACRWRLLFASHIHSESF